MPAATLARKLAAVRLAMARAEELGEADLADLAAELGLKQAHLCRWIDAVIAIEDRVADDWDADRDRFARRDGTTLTVRRNILRDLETKQPDSDTSVRLLVAARLYQEMEPDTTNLPLARAISKLERVVGHRYPVVVAPAKFYGEAIESFTDTTSRVLWIEYLSDSLETTQREIEPIDVWASGGHWYLEAFDRLRGVVRPFRIDRIQRLRKTRETVARRERSLTGRFDLSDIEHRLTVRVQSSLIDAFRAFDVRVEAERGLGDGTAEADLVVFGERRLDQLLLSLGPDGEILAPTEYRTRRADRARALLDRYV